MLLDTTVALGRQAPGDEFMRILLKRLDLSALQRLFFERG